MKDRALSVKVELSHNNLTKGGHILHEQEYNTGHGVQAVTALFLLAAGLRLNGLGVHVAGYGLLLTELLFS